MSKRKAATEADSTSSEKKAKTGKSANEAAVEGKETKVGAAGAADPKGGAGAPDDPVDAALTCPICMHWFYCDVYQCSAGHLVCDACMLGLKDPKQCPTCRIPISKLIRNLAVEALAAATVRPCVRGCGYTSKIPQLASHLCPDLICGPKDAEKPCLLLQSASWNYGSCPQHRVFHIRTEGKTTSIPVDTILYVYEQAGFRRSFLIQQPNPQDRRIACTRFTADLRSGAKRVFLSVLPAFFHRCCGRALPLRLRGDDKPEEFL